MSVISRYRWRMSIGMTLTLSTLVLALVFALYSRTPTFAAGSLVQISSDPFTNNTSNHKTEVEPDTFAFGNTIVSAFQVGRFFNGGASDIGFATSTDGGASWVHGFLPGTTPFSTPAGMWARTSDASVAFDASHGVWLISFLGLFPNGNTNEVDVLASRSTDGGLTWSNPVPVNTSGDFNDKNWTVCDNTASSPHFGNCYTEFDDFSKLNLFQMSTSTNGGLMWGAAATNPNHTCVIAGQPLVQPNGTVIVPIDDCFETSILSITSTDGGLTWSNPVLAAEIINNGNPGGIRSPDLPSAEIDKSGRVYVTWSDCRFENFCSAPIGTNDLLLISSADGVNWTPPERVPTAPLGSGADFFTTGLAVDSSTSGSSAHLGLAYYFYPNSNCTIRTCQLNVGFISSTNGGATWSDAQQLAGPMTLTWLPLTTQGFMVADYISTSIVNGADNATPVFEVAFEPTVGHTCSNIHTGAPGSHCNQATFTSLQALASGANAATTISASASSQAQLNAKKTSSSKTAQTAQ